MNLEKFETKIDKMSDPEVLELVRVLLKDRIKIGHQFVTNSDELVVGSVVHVVAGDYMIAGEPVLLSWPLQLLPIPEAFKEANPERFN